MGDVIGDINGRRGTIVELNDRMGMKSVEALVPLANMFQVRLEILAFLFLCVKSAVHASYLGFSLEHRG